MRKIQHLGIGSRILILEQGHPVKNSVLAAFAMDKYSMCRVVQVRFTPETEVFYMLFDRSISIFSVTELGGRLQFQVLDPVGPPCGNESINFT